MPTERFYRLPAEKKRIIREAAFREFARVPIDKVSINRIIKDADISRGSFYTYFEDKWDILRYIFEKGRAEIQRFCQSCLEESGGDVWYMLERLLDKMLDMCSEQEKFDFIKNALNHSSSEELVRELSEMQLSGTCDQMKNWMVTMVFDNYSREKVKSMDYKEFAEFFQMAMFSVAVEVKGYFEGKTIPEIQESFARKREILRFGVCPV